jgi:uracil-DNA glycosylase
MVSNLSLREKVSVLDVEPFYNSKFKPTEEQKNMLNDLVFRAISAKRPKAILCMGNVRLNDRKDNDRIKLITGQDAQRFFSLRKHWLRSDIGSPVRSFYTIHPSHSLHFAFKDSRKIRQQLFNDISRACKELEAKELDTSLNCQLGNPKQHIYFSVPAANDDVAKVKDVQTVRGFHTF